jgi:hypothetical protein
MLVQKVSSLLQNRKIPCSQEAYHSRCNNHLLVQPERAVNSLCVCPAHVIKASMKHEATVYDIFPNHYSISIKLRLELIIFLATAAIACPLIDHVSAKEHTSISPKSRHPINWAHTCNMNEQLDVNLVPAKDTNIIPCGFHHTLN